MQCSSRLKIHIYQQLLVGTNNSSIKTNAMIVFIGEQIVLFGVAETANEITNINQQLPIYIYYI